MALTHHIEALKQKHADIDRQLHEESLRISVDPLVLNRLKALKLSVKDEIERLSTQESAAA